MAQSLDHDIVVALHVRTVVYYLTVDFDPGVTLERHQMRCDYGFGTDPTVVKQPCNDD